MGTCARARFLACAWRCLASIGLDIADPRGADRKRLVTYVEIDRCATDAIALVTGCRLGKRALKFRDWGKMAATFVDLALRPRRSHRCSRRFPRTGATSCIRMKRTKTAANCWPIASCRCAALREQWVRVVIESADLPGQSSDRVICRAAEKGVNSDGLRSGQRE